MNYRCVPNPATTAALYVTDHLFQYNSSVGLTASACPPLLSHPYRTVAAIIMSRDHLCNMDNACINIFGLCHASVDVKSDYHSLAPARTPTVYKNGTHKMDGCTAKCSNRPRHGRRLAGTKT